MCAMTGLNIHSFGRYIPSLAILGDGVRRVGDNIFPLYLWEREKILNERSEFSILGEGFIRAPEERKVRSQAFIRILRYYGSSVVGSFVKILCKPQVLDGTAALPPLFNSLPKGAIGQYIENHPSPQPSPIGEGVSNSHPELVSGSHKKLKHRGQSSVYKMLKQVQHDVNLLKRTYSPIHLFTYSLHKQAAFTLAEVLITLGVIGVVAAMTLPQ